MRTPSTIPIVTAPARTRAKTARDAFELLLARTELRVAAGVRSPATLAMQREHAEYLRFAGVRVHAAPELLAELGARWRQIRPGSPLVMPWPSANSWLRRACARLGLPRLTTHSLRHTFFTWYVWANGFTAELLELGGWKDLTIPARVYAHAAPTRLREQIERTHALVMGLGPRRPPRKISRKAEPGPTPAGDCAVGSGAGRMEVRPAPEPAHGTMLPRRGAIAPYDRVGDMVGPAGFEPAAYGLKVQRSRSTLPRAARPAWVDAETDHAAPENCRGEVAGNA